MRKIAFLGGYLVIWRCIMGVAHSRRAIQGHRLGCNHLGRWQLRSTIACAGKCSAWDKTVGKSVLEREAAE